MTVTVDPSSSPQIDLAVDVSNNVIASVKLLSGSLLSTSNDPVTIEFRPVADSLLRSAENAVHPTRQTEFGAQLSYAETLLSVAFECAVPTTVVSPFALNLTYSATIDFTRRPITQLQNSGPDVCLAYLYRIPALRYSRWTCFPDGAARRNAPPSAGVQLNRVAGPISDCGKGPFGKIYGFIHSPLKATNVEVVSKEKTWAEKNVLLVLMIFLLAAIMLILCVYCGFRLQRYRKKYLKEAAAVDKMIDEVDEMQQYGGTAGTKDDEVEMIPNIMVVQLQQLQETMNTQTKEEKEKELEQLRLDSEERKKHLETLRADRDNLAAELAQLQSDLHKQQNAPVARPVIEDFSPQETSLPTSVDIPSTALRVDTQSTKATFQSVRPTKKKNL
jgi:shikimate kinase